MRYKSFSRTKIQATDWLSHIAGLAPGADDFDIVQVAFKNTRTGFYRNPHRLNLKPGDLVAVDAAPGHDIGSVVLTGPLARKEALKGGDKNVEDLKIVFRIARQADLEKFREARSREHETMIRSRKIAAELGLEMKIGDVEYQGDGMKAIFYYIANERVDFRKLIRILADTFKIRIEMKQIGARQEAGRIGGIGPCGRPLCCSTWINHFVSVGTVAARIQDLSMNPQKLAGQCAKLKCCLNFETAAYSDAHKQLPHKDVTLETKDATYYFFKSDILARQITYSTDKNLAVNTVTISASRAFEIIALNKQGIKVDALEENPEDMASQSEYVDLVEQESLTRFDKSKRRRNRKSGGHDGGRRRHNDERPDEPERTEQPERGERTERQERGRNRNRNNSHKNQDKR